MKNLFNVFLIGVGGQGIGILSELLLRSSDYAGYKTKGVDTHGLAQRGGIVSSHLRIGEEVHSPLITPNTADLVVSLERFEALRGLVDFGKQGGTLVFYDTVWQPLGVRLKKADSTTRDEITAECKNKNIREFVVFYPELEDAKMQNTAVAANICKHNLIPGIRKEHYLKGLNDILPPKVLEKNLALFERLTEVNDS